MNAYDRVLEASQNNVTNASTPGYVRQRLQLQALTFDPGGVRVGDLQSARNEYAERAVRRQNVGLGREQQNVSSMSSLESLFDISGTSGIPKALNLLNQAFSAWGASPGNVAGRQAVILQAGNTAQAFQQVAAGLDTLAEDTNNQLRDTVKQINLLVGELHGYNTEALKGNGGSPGLDAQIHAKLEELSQYVDFTATEQPDHTVTVLLNGQVPLLIEDKQFPLSTGVQNVDAATAAFPNAPPLAYVRAADGTAITGQVTDGQLGALIAFRNQTLPTYMGDTSQPGDVNRMAKAFADRVNGILTSGEVSAGPPPVNGSPLFVYDATDDNNVAATLQVDPAFTSDQLGATAPGPPPVSNGIPLALSALASPTLDADKIDGVSFSEFFGALAANAGSGLEDATTGQQVQQSLVGQAKVLRQQLSGISLDEEATLLIQFQRGYQAVSKYITVLDTLTQSVIDILR